MSWTFTSPSNTAPLRQGDIDGAVRMLRAASLNELRNEAFLREEFLPALGLNDEILDEFPRELYPWCGRGIQSWQYPVQFARYLTILAERNIRSYVEFGCRFGGTFIIVVEYIRRFSDLNLAVAMDIEQTAIMTAYAAQTPDIRYVIANSASPQSVSFLGGNQWDLAFVDGDHSYAGCTNDYQSVKNSAKLIALHDIVSSACPGVVHAWGEIRKVVPQARLVEIVDQYRDVQERTRKNFLGIGLIDFG